MLIPHFPQEWKHSFVSMSRSADHSYLFFSDACRSGADLFSFFLLGLWKYLQISGRPGESHWCSVSVKGRKDAAAVTDKPTAFRTGALLQSTGKYPVFSTKLVVLTCSCDLASNTA